MPTIGAINRGQDPINRLFVRGGRQSMSVQVVPGVLRKAGNADGKTTLPGMPAPKKITGLGIKPKTGTGMLAASPLTTSENGKET